MGSAPPPVKRVESLMTSLAGHLEEKVQQRNTATELHCSRNKETFSFPKLITGQLDEIYYLTDGPQLEAIQ